MFRTFSFLSPALYSRGIYVIEDIQEKPYVLAFLHALLEAVNFMPPGSLRDWPKLTSFPAGTPWLVRNTIGVAFHRYIAFIERGHNPRDNRFLVEPEVYDARIAERQALVAAAAAELRSEGTSVNQETLQAKLGFNMRNQITRYLETRF